MNIVSFRSKLAAHTAIAALLSGTMLTSPAIGQDALPTGGQVVAGSATIETSGSTMTVNQSSDAMIANWQSFSVGAGNAVTFNQPNAQSTALNRVIGQDPSQILGSLTANGKVFLVNPNGIVIGKNGSVQSGGFVGSTLGMSNADFLGGNYRFTGTGGTILNQGDLKGGVVALIAPRVSNEGTIGGDTALAAGSDVTLDFNGDGLIGVEVTASSLATLVENNGLIKADGGLAILTAKGANDALKGIVNNTGTVEAQTLAASDGRILLLGDMENGEVNAAGLLRAKNVETSAAQVNIDGNLLVQSDVEGGHWLIDPTDLLVNSSVANSIEQALEQVDVTLSTAAPGSDDGTIRITSSISWDEHALTLRADKDIIINAPLIVNDEAGLVLQFAQTNSAGDYYVNSRIDLDSTSTFKTKQGSGPLIDHTIITSLGQSSSSGDGTLQGMRGNLNGNYVLGRNINASATGNWSKGFNPIGGGNEPRFTGNFDGLGHTISNLSIDRPTENDVGLFGATSSAVIRNVNLTNVDVVGNNSVGALVGFNDETPIRNVSSSGDVKGELSVGGLLGSSYYSTATELETSGDVEGRWLVGGLIGSKRDGEVSDSSSSADVEGMTDVGGLVGHNNGGDLLRVEASGSVTGTTEIGGLVGWNDAGGWIYRSSATGDVTGEQMVGGLVGRNGTVNNLVGTIERSSASGDVTGYTNVGALVGFDYGEVINSSGTGQVAILTRTGPPSPPPGTLTVNGVATTYSTSQAPYQPTISLTGTGFSNVAEVRFSWTDPNGQTGTATWNAANNFGNGRFVVGAGGTSATIAPVLVAANDPSGTYQWTVTFVAGTQVVSRSFTVNYNGVVSPPPPPPPPVVLSLTGSNAEIYSTDAVPYRPSITLVGQGLNSVTSITLSWTGPDSGSTTWNSSSEFNGGRFEPSASGSSAVIRPTVLTSGDAPGTYVWTVTLNNGNNTVSRKFTVVYSAALLEPPLVQVPVQEDNWLDPEHLQQLQSSITAPFASPDEYTSEQIKFINDYWSICSSCKNFTRFEITPEVILHWGRNDIKKTPAYLTVLDLETAARQNGWILTVAPESDEAFHENNVDEVVKYISNSGHEWVFDTSTGFLVTNDSDKGTFNYGSDPETIDHIVLDIAPWIKWGSGPNDSTTRDQREEMAMRGLSDKLKNELSAIMAD